MSEVRTFLAIELPPSIRRTASELIEKLRRSGVSMRYVNPETIHLTICFLGDIEDRLILDACRVVERRLKSQARFRLSIGGLGAFPNLDRPRVVWLGVESGTEPLVELQRELTQDFGDHGFYLDRGRYIPHVTLGRMPQGRMGSEFSEALQNMKEWEASEFEVSELVLFSSQLEREGPIYTPMARFPI